MTYLAAICVLLIYTGRVVQHLDAFLLPAGGSLQFAQRVRFVVRAADQLRSVGRRRTIGRKRCTIITLKLLAITVRCFVVRVHFASRSKMALD